jgi:hypothetical protein
MIDCDLLRDLERSRTEELCRRFFPNGRKVCNEWKFADVSGARGNSLGVALAGQNAGLWQDRATGEGGDFVKLLCANRDLTFVQAVEEIERASGVNLHSENGEALPEVSNQREPERKREPLKLEGLQPCQKTDALQIVKLRGIRIEGLRLAHQRKVLFAYNHQFHGRCWVITDDARRNAIARKLDGKLFDGDKKSLCLKGSEANWPIGIAQAQGFPAIALCEGAPDLLAAFWLAWAGAAESLVMPVCMTGAACRIHDDALPMFRGKRVRIFGHADEAGQDAIQRWADQLSDVQAEVDGFDFEGLVKADGSPVKDLNEFLWADHKASGCGIEIVTGAFDFALERRG